MKFLILAFLLLTTNVNANLPPTTSKGIGDTTDVTTFKYRFPNQTISRSGTTTTFGGGVTTTQKNAITPVAGMEVYDSTLGIKQYYNGTQWIANSNIQLNNTYSAQMSSVGVVSNENTDWINGSCAYASNEWTCTFNTGLVTTGMNCAINVTDDTSGASVRGVVSTSSNLKFRPVQDGTGYNQKPVSIVCQKGAGDYQSTDAYISSNGNYDWTSYTPTLTGFGTVTNLSAFHKREGSDLLVRMTFTQGTVAASTASITLPGSLAIDTSKITLASSAGNDSPIVGNYAGATAGAGAGVIVASTTTSASIVYFGNTYGNVATTTIAARNGNIIGSTGAVMSVSFRVPISGWTNSNLIVASLQGTPNIPGSTVKVDNIFFSYGTTNSNTVCSASPCSYLDQLGSGSVTSVTRGGTGSYIANLTRTYSKIKCTGNSTRNAGDGISIMSGAGNSILNCANCSSVSFSTLSSAFAAADSFGTINCIGEY